MKQYYDHRAPEYDDWYLGVGRFAQRDRPGWEQDLTELQHDVAALAPARTLDVACGTGFLTRHLRGEITAFDQSERMLEVASERVPDAELISGDALALPFADGSFDRLFTGHFYGHLQDRDREVFFAEAHRVASELVIVDSARRPDHEPEEWQERVLNDGSRYEVYKRFFEPDALAEELGGGTVLHASRWFVMVSSRSPRS
ncbi:MAG TPA: class I SAM-dependent methyltransferase [Solirubrobacteraceae bacterium]|jgi:demethylmenaquinone methyltransferase/2-methoxy-6-polyprenyl-1,4-benzoquinol methylase|nr:class I SAM-dependent methyltransferase [Solirubrobacteraceae bacterium]